jgi:hypothetical protein
MAITLNGTTGISNDGGYTGDGVSFTDTTPANTLVTTTGGNVGIGTSSPTAKTTISASVGSVATGQLLIKDPSYEGVALAQGSSGEGYLYNIANSYLTFGTNNTERMRIDTNGHLLVGTTTSLGNTRLTLNGATAGNWSVGPGVSYNVFYILNSSNTGVYINSGATSWTSASDERLKNVTGEIKNGLSKVCSLRAAEYTWKADKNNKPQVGLIAQDVQKVLPEVISEVDGNLGVQYTEVIPLLVAAIKEQQTIINDLKARIEALEQA